MILDSIKPKLCLAYGARIESTGSLGDIWVPNNSITKHMENCVWTSVDAIKNKLKAASAPLTKNSTLYFGKTSNFPRFKLTASNDFKRCIKEDRADFFVIGNLTAHSYKYNVAIFEDELNLYIISDMNYYVERVKTNSVAAERAWKSDPIKYILDNQLYYGVECKLIYKGEMLNVTKDQAFDIENLMNGTYSKVVTDEDIEKVINQNLPTLAQDDIDSVTSLLDSPDTANQELGLKLLASYNVIATPLTVRTILGLREKLSRTNAWGSVSVQQMLKSIHWIDFIRFPFAIWNALQLDKSNKGQYSDYDKSLIITLYRKAAQDYLQQSVDRLDSSGILQTFGLKCNYEIV